MMCIALNATGAPCQSPEHTVNADGLCRAHRPGGREALVERAGAGGRSFHARAAGAAFTVEELPRIETVDDAKRALDDIRVATLTRRITATEGTSAARTIDVWIRGHASSLTGELVNSLREALDAKTAEIETLRRQIAKHPRASLVVSSGSARAAT